MLEIALLGPLEVRCDGRPVAVPAGKASELLVRLALDAGAPVRAERLIDELWGAGAMTTRRNTLQSKVAMLRRALGDPALLANRDGGYVLDVEPPNVDALAVVGVAAAAARALDTGDPRDALELGTSALLRYRGDLLPAAGDGDWVDPHRTRLHETRMALVETQLAARLQLGETGDVVGELEAAVATYPFREGLWELLITALYRLGRQADALSTYARVKRQLADELGLDPGPGLQQLEQHILVQDPALAAAERAPARPVGNLPSLAAGLVGRQAELAELTALLGRERLVELVGPGGIGKTVVALATGRALQDSFRGGVWLARLEAAVTGDDVVDTLVAALGVPGEDALLERFKGNAALVILDNCEHVVDAAAALTERLLDAAPGLRVLCTSQVPLGLAGESLLTLSPLPLEDAAELFRQRAAAQGRRAADDEARDAAVLNLCRFLDGLPLAIELAAARTRTLSIHEITRRLDDRFHVLSDPTSRQPERRRSLRSTIGWSYDLLFPDDQRGLWALATFAGGAPLAAVESVLAALDVPAAAAIDVVDRLASRSLVIVDDVAGPQQTATTRYRLLDSIRAFALDALAEAGWSARAQAAHLAWYVDAADASTAGVRGREQAEHLAFARLERANLDAALAWSVAHDPPLALRLVRGFGWAWVVLGDSRGAQRIHAALDAVGDAGSATDRADALLLAGWIEASTGHLALARTHVDAAGELAESVGDRDLQARSDYYLAYVVSHHGEWQQALDLTQRSRARYDGLDRPWDQAALWLFAARAAISAGDEQRSVAALAQVQHWLGSIEDPWLHVRHDAMAGELARVQHRFDDAVTHLGRAAATSRRLGFQQTEAYQLSSLGRALCQAGNYVAGPAALEQAIEKAEATGDVRLAALARVHWGRVLRATGDLARARMALEAASAWHRAAGGGEQAALGECLLAALDAADEVPDAEARLHAVLDEARRDEAAHVEVFALDALARIAATAGDQARADELAAGADRRMAAASHFITDRDRTDRAWLGSLSGLHPTPGPV